MGTEIAMLGGSMISGAMSSSSSDDANRNAREAADRSYELSKQELAFQREQYDDWKAVYGPLQEDLGVYMRNLNVGTVADAKINKYVTEIQAESQNVERQLKQNLSQRGMANSGLDISLTNQNLYQAGMAKAGVRATAYQEAEDSVLSKQMGFLGLGLGQGTQMLSTQASVANQGASSQASLGGQYINQATTYGTTNQNNFNQSWGAGTAMLEKKGWIS